MKLETRPGLLLARRYQARREMNEMEMKNSIGGVMYRHLLRLENTQSELNEQLLDTLTDFGLTRKTFITGENFITTRGIHIAEEAHKLQKRKYAGQPYMVHPLRVALLSIDLAHTMGEEVNHELAIGALMHDTIEDSPKFGPDGTGGAAFKKETVKNLFGSWSLLGHIAENIAADADAFDHNTAIEYGILNDTLYHAKLQHWRRAVMMRRRTIKAADRIDNVLDPISLEGGLVNPISIMAEKLAGKREN